MENEITEEQHYQLQDDGPPNSYEASSAKKASKVKIVRRESSRLQNFLLKKIKFNNNNGK